MITIYKILLNDRKKSVRSYFNNLSEEEINIINQSSLKEIDISEIKFDNKMIILKETFGISRNLPLNSINKKENLLIFQNSIQNEKPEIKQNSEDKDSYYLFNNTNENSHEIIVKNNNIGIDNKNEKEESNFEKENEKKQDEIDLNFNKNDSTQLNQLNEENEDLKNLIEENLKITEIRENEEMNKLIEN